MNRLGAARWCLVVLVLACADAGRSEQPSPDEGAKQEPRPSPQPVADPEPAPEPEPTGAGADALQQTRERLLAAAQIEPGMVVADIGASRGWFVDRAALAVGPEGLVYATDIDSGAIEVLREQAAIDNSVRGRIEVRHCTGERDTGLSDLPDGSVDLMLMIDSLCFDGRFPREQDLAYLREFLRILRPGARLLHHMDCECELETQAAIELFEAAGFEAELENLELPQPPAGDRSWTCRTTQQRQRHRQLLRFVRPGSSKATRH